MDHRLDTWGAIYQFQTNTNSQKASTNHWWSYQQSGFNPKHWYHLKQWVCPQMYAKCIGSWNQQPQEQYWVPSLFPQTSQSIHPVISFKPSTSRWLFSYNQGTLIPQTLPWFQPAALWFAGGGGGEGTWIWSMRQFRHISDIEQWGVLSFLSKYTCWLSLLKSWPPDDKGSRGFLDG